MSQLITHWLHCVWKKLAWTIIFQDGGGCPVACYVWVSSISNKTYWAVKGQVFLAKIESSCRGAVLQATDLLHPPRLAMLFASRAVCKFSSLIPKKLTWIKYHQLHPPYSIHLPWYNQLGFLGGVLWQVFTYQLLSGGSFWKTDNNIIIPVSPYNS